MSDQAPQGMSAWVPVLVALIVGVGGFATARLTDSRYLEMREQVWQLEDTIEALTDSTIALLEALEERQLWLHIRAFRVGTDSLQARVFGLVDGVDVSFPTGRAWGWSGTSDFESDSIPLRVGQVPQMISFRARYFTDSGSLTVASVETIAIAGVPYAGRYDLYEPGKAAPSAFVRFEVRVVNVPIR